MNSTWNQIIWQQFGAAIDMLENAMRACPEELWYDQSRRPEFWYLVFHTLFFLDFYLSESEKGFTPPAPFTLDELDPAGIFPERPYTKEELQSYLDHGRQKCRMRIRSLSERQVGQRCAFVSPDVTEVELLFYNMRHVQHHAAQLNLILRQTLDFAPRWVRQTSTS